MNLRDVAQRAGVSPMTVSNVLNGRESVRPENRERVLEAVRALGYTPNVSARQLRRGRAHVLGIVVPEAVNPFYGDMVRGVEDRALEDGVTTLTMTSHDSFEREKALLDLLTGMRVMGGVLASVSNWQAIRPYIRSMPDDITIVALAAEDDVEDACSSVAGDDALGGELVGRHLASLGHQRITFVGGAAGPSVFQARYSGLLRGLVGSVRPSGVDYVECAEPSLEAGYVGALGFLRSAKRRPTAVFCANDLLALGALRAAAELDIRVPDDLAIVGYDDIPFAAGATVPLTSVRQPTREMGRRAAELVLGPGDGAEPIHEVFAPTLEVRASTRGGGRR